MNESIIRAITISRQKEHVRMENTIGISSLFLIMLAFFIPIEQEKLFLNTKMPTVRRAELMRERF